MSSRSSRRRPLAIAGLAAGILGAPHVVFAQIPCRYDVTVIKSDVDCHGNLVTIPQGMNEQGVVVGYYQCSAGNPKPFLWTPESGFTSIAPPPGYSSVQPVDVNDTLQITGTMGCATRPCRAFLYDDATFLDLGVLPGATHSGGDALSRDAQVVGSSGGQAFVWDGDVMMALELPLGPDSRAWDINDSGQIVGRMGPSQSQHGFLWDGGKVVDLGVVPGGSTSQAIAINNLAEPQVVGYGQLPDATHAFLWDSGQFTDLGALPGYLRSFAFDINDSSTVVGFCRDPNDRAFVWHDGVMANLNDLVSADLGITIKRAEALDNAGRIAARGSGPDGVVGWLLTPVEPPLGDLEGDCTVGFLDLLALLNSWGPCADCKACPADLDNDCSVGMSDLLILLSNWS